MTRSAPIMTPAREGFPRFSAAAAPALAIHRGLWPEGRRHGRGGGGPCQRPDPGAGRGDAGGPPEKVVDLGCGVGGSVFHLAPCLAASRVFAASAPSVPCNAAAPLAEAARGVFAARCRFAEADFIAPPDAAGGPGADLAIAIEAHVHAPSAAAFLVAARRHLRPGGVLVVVDDMLRCSWREKALTGGARLDVLVGAASAGAGRLGHCAPTGPVVRRPSPYAAGFAVEAIDDLTPLLRLDRLARPRPACGGARGSDRIGAAIRWPAVRQHLISR